MSLSSQANLEALARDPRAAWLWDVDRLRLVWANPAGLAFWKCDSLFDLLDRRFDAGEPGVDRVVQIARSLRDTTSIEEDFSFPSSGRRDSLRFRCSVTGLKDGRPGLLMVGETAPKAAAAQTIDAGFDALPMAIVTVDDRGQLTGHNAAARELVAGGEDGVPATSLATLLGSDALAGDLLDRAGEAGMVSEVRPLHTPIGERVHRLNVRHLPGAGSGGDRFMILFDDITERRQHEQSLLDAQARLADFVAAAGDFTWQTDDELVWREVSEGFEAAVGVAADTVLGRGFDEVANRYGLDPDGSLAAACRARRPWRRTVTWRHAAGSSRVVLSGVPAMSGGGAFAGYRGIGARADGEPAVEARETATPAPREGPRATGETRLDEEDRRTLDAIGEVLRSARDEAEAAPGTQPVTATEVPAPAPVAPALDDNGAVQKRLCALLDAAPLAIMVHRDAKILYANAAAAAALGVDGATLRPGSAIDGLFAERDVLQAGLREAAADGGVVRRALTSCGAQAKPLEAQFATVEWIDGPAQQITLSEPAKAAPRSIGPREAELEAILDTATDGIITLDGKGRIITLNASAEAIFGRDTAEVEGRPLTELMMPESAKTVRDYLASLTGSGIASILNDGREVVAVEKNGGEVPLFLTLGRMRPDGEETVSGVTYCAVVRDITQWKKAEADLKRAKDSAERESVQKSEFLAAISHELRTPLNAIIGFSEVMTTEKFGPLANERYKGYVNDIHTSGEHLLSLINDLLDLSKVEAGKLELNFTSVNLADIIQQSVGIMQPQATRERIIIRSSVAPKLPPVVADQRSMRQILLNLVSNAIKFTDPGGQVIVSALMDDAGRVQVRVKDTGIGMSKEQLGRAMEPFRQIARADRAERKGTGLGLPLTKALAEANRAEFSIESEPDNGTMVQITFPTTRVLAD